MFPNYLLKTKMHVPHFQPHILLEGSTEIIGGETPPATTRAIIVPFSNPKQYGGLG
jgi:hypothetical protein